MKSNMSFKEQQNYRQQKILNDITIDRLRVNPREIKKKIIEYKKQRSIQEWYGVDDKGELV
jgi:hypothetical protein|tara:strand:- start:492 stop:674 length:183 start_codon:yes stop_codon:yes gene_type:complete